MLSKIGEFFKKIWAKVSKFLKKLWDKLKPYLAAIAFAIIVGMAFITPPITTFLGSVLLAELATVLAGNWVLAAVLGLGAAYLIDPEGVSDLVDKVAKGVRNIVVKAAETLGEVTRAGLGGLFGPTVSKIFPWLIVGTLGYAGYRMASSIGGSDTGSAQGALYLPPGESDSENEQTYSDSSSSTPVNDDDSYVETF